MYDAQRLSHDVRPTHDSTDTSRWGARQGGGRATGDPTDRAMWGPGPQVAPQPQQVLHPEQADNMGTHVPSGFGGRARQGQSQDQGQREAQGQASRGGRKGSVSERLKGEC